MRTHNMSAAARELWSLALTKNYDPGVDDLTVKLGDLTLLLPGRFKLQMVQQSTLTPIPFPNQLCPSICPCRSESHLAHSVTLSC